MLKIQNIYAGYGHNDILQNVSIDIPTGKLVALIGSNGAGKTTTMRVASGMLAPKSGALLLNGNNFHGQSAHSVNHLGISHVPEGRRIFSTLSVMDNLKVGAFRRSFFGMSASDINTDLEMVFERFPRLKERRGQLAGTLSGGEQQMLAIGRGLMSKPSVLLLDEPSMGLSPKLVEDVFTTVVALKEAGITMLLVEQFAEAALEIADYAYVMESGKIVLEGLASSLRNDQAVRDAYLGATH